MTSPPTPSGGSSPARGLLRLVSPLFIAAGVGLVIWDVLMGRATFYLVLIFPVVAGTSALLLIGAFLIVVGVFLLPLTLGGFELEEEPPAPMGPSSSGSPSAGTSAGGLILLGPVPLFLGSWRSAPSWAYGLAAAVGSVLLVLFLLLLFGVL